jgi:hypothetical protein
MGDANKQAYLILYNSVSLQLPSITLQENDQGKKNFHIQV